MPSARPMAKYANDADKATADTCSTYQQSVRILSMVAAYGMRSVANLDLGRTQQNRSTRLLLDGVQVPDFEKWMPYCVFFLITISI